jgi:hypothetical protein
VEVKVYLSAREGAVDLVHAGGDLDPDGDRVRDAHPLSWRTWWICVYNSWHDRDSVRSFKILAFLQNVPTTVSGQQGSR